MQKTHKYNIFIFTLISLLTLSCLPNLQSGDTCEASGSGFTRYNPCEIGLCIDWELTCPNDTKLIPLKCSGIICGDGSQCPEDEECIQIDSFKENSRCLKKTFCSS